MHTCIQTSYPPDLLPAFEPIGADAIICHFKSWTFFFSFFFAFLSFSSENVVDVQLTLAILEKLHSIRYTNPPNTMLNSVLIVLELGVFFTRCHAIDPPALLRPLPHFNKYLALSGQCPVMCGSCNKAPQVDRRAISNQPEITVNGKLRGMVPQIGLRWGDKVWQCVLRDVCVYKLHARLFMDCF